MKEIISGHLALRSRHYQAWYLVHQLRLLFHSQDIWNTCLYILSFVTVRQLRSLWTKIERFLELCGRWMSITCDNKGNSWQEPTEIRPLPVECCRSTADNILFSLPRPPQSTEPEEFRENHFYVTIHDIIKSRACERNTILPLNRN